MSIALAILAVAFATLTWQPVLAAEEPGGNDDSTGSSEPTITDVNNAIQALSATVANLATLTSTLATASALQTLTAKVDRQANRGQQMAIFMSDPSSIPAGLYQIGDSTIPGFPPGPKDANGRIAQFGVAGLIPPLNPATVLPAGTYLFEVQQPRTDNVACIRSVTQRFTISSAHKWGKLRIPICPSISVTLSSRTGGRVAELRDGLGIYTTDGTESLAVRHSFPRNFTFTSERPRIGYVGGVVVTKVK